MLNVANSIITHCAQLALSSHTRSPTTQEFVRNFSDVCADIFALWIRGTIFDYCLVDRPSETSNNMSIELDTLKNERDRLRESLREVETEVRKAEAELKGLRQREIQTKREIEALSTLIDIKEQRDAKPAEGT